MLLRLGFFLAALYLVSPVIAVFLAIAVNKHQYAGLTSVLVSVISLGAAFVFRSKKGLYAASVALLVLAALLMHTPVVEIDFVDNLEPGSVAVVTGGSKGIGLGVVQRLLQMEQFSQVVALSRSPPGIKSPRFRWIKDDLSSIQGQVAVAAQLDRVDLLVLNAGVGGYSFSHLTKEGIPAITAINHVSQAKLLEELLPKLKKSKLARVAFVASESNMFADAELVLAPMDAPSAPQSWILDQEGYGRTKALQIMYAKAMAKRHPEVHFSSLHPGAIASEIMVEQSARATDLEAASLAGYGTRRLWWLLPYIGPLVNSLAKTFWEPVEQGASRVLFSMDKSVPSGVFIDHPHFDCSKINPVCLVDEAIEKVYANTREYL